MLRCCRSTSRRGGQILKLSQKILSPVWVDGSQDAFGVGTGAGVLCLVVVLQALLGPKAALSGADDILIRRPASDGWNRQGGLRIQQRQLLLGPL